ncbi:MAG TPA: hypothetical protein DDZ96_01720 [Porphyromonadaceae bacterium]|jgi:hypothetical protein|nr:hypothetical protein [Porphyromonadaceae bacterium]HBK33188.1 hypothetical protein [Porphyromonadaceae bacterium]HBL32524.1 hypothetical protein [Porphyromonadaceae bacterium]HBX20341.1 hypothetical protein [Porphyromonadaceae bacterium]HBX45978.1 hypothetical protein [Porphyromonadaceae bacterium]
MPEAVKEFRHIGSFLAVADIQNRVLNEYIADMANANRRRYAWPSPDAEILSENGIVRISVKK